MKKRQQKKAALSLSSLSATELATLCGALNEVLDLYEGDELHARLGATEAELQTLYQKLHSMLSS